MKRIVYIFLIPIIAVFHVGASQNSLAQELDKAIENAHAGEILSVSLSNDASTILTGGSDKRCYLWNVKSGKKLKSFGGHSGKVTGVSFSSNNKLK